MAAVFMGFSSPRVGNTRILFDVDLVNQDLLNHFNTKKGERVMDSEYGCIAWDLIFALDIESNVSALDSDIRRIVSTEPRVQLLNLTITAIEQGYEAVLDLKYVQLDHVDQLYINFIRENDNNVNS